MPHLILLVVLLVVTRDASAVRGPRPEACRAARYVIAGDPIPLGSATAAAVDVGPVVALGDTCTRVEPQRVQATRKGVTKVRARWDGCPGVDGAVSLTAKIVDDCQRLVGRVRGKKLRQRIEAARSDCGDGFLETPPPDVPWVGTEASLDTHALPRWFDDAKLGIMIHWGIFSIPAWAETILDPAEWLKDLSKLTEPPLYGREWFTHIPYVEWYSNTMLIEGSPTQLHHDATYGADFPYEAFRPQFDAAAAAWSAEPWADLFAASGARYVVLVTKHHDGYALWPTEVPHPKRPGWHAERDYVGELTGAARQRCLRMGLYYSGGLDWSVQPGPIASLLDLNAVIPQSAEYVAYADGQWRELIARYQPALMWNDIGYPTDADELALMADYYNAVPDGVVNDRFGILPGLVRSDYFTPEFNISADISEAKFETVRGMGRGFGYNQNERDEDLISPDGLVAMLVDIVSKNGNLLLNVGPLADGTIPAAQVERLQFLGAWLGVNGEAIFGSRPWTRAEGQTTSGASVRFTQSKDGGTLYAIVLGAVAETTVTFAGLEVTTASVRLLGTDGEPTAARDGANLRVELPAAPAGSAAHVFALGL
jgi:alpha-L-fucosidase